MIAGWPLIFGALAGCASLAGGHLVLRMPQKAVLFQALASGMMMGAALFDLLPEAIALRSDCASLPLLVTASVCFGSLFVAHQSRKMMRKAGWRALIIPGFLVLHSLMDGTSIGLAFQFTIGTGWLVALAILAHDLADGVNIASLSASRRSASLWLLVNALAPVLGAFLGGAFTISAPILSMLLAAMAGIFLYIGAFHLIPDSLAGHRFWATASLVAAGLFSMAIITSLIDSA